MISFDETLQFADKGFHEISQIWAASFGIYSLPFYYRFLWERNRAMNMQTTVTHDGTVSFIVVLSKIQSVLLECDLKS